MEGQWLAFCDKDTLREAHSRPPLSVAKTVVSIKSVHSEVGGLGGRWPKLPQASETFLKNAAPRPAGGSELGPRSWPRPARPALSLGAAQPAVLSAWVGTGVSPAAPGSPAKRGTCSLWPLHPESPTDAAPLLVPTGLLKEKGGGPWLVPSAGSPWSWGYSVMAMWRPRGPKTSQAWPVPASPALQTAGAWAWLCLHSISCFQAVKLCDARHVLASVLGALV